MDGITLIVLVSGEISPPSYMRKGLVISDLHLFSRRSRADELLAGMEEELGKADLLVLNGDMFDFRWSILADRETTIRGSLEWLSDLLEVRQSRPIHYLLGNHDCLTDFTEKLSGLAERYPSLICHDSFLLLGRNLFLHGDCANGRMDEEGFQKFRRSWSNDRQRGQVAKVLYDGVDALGASRLFHELWFPEHVTVRRVAYHLDHILPGWREEIDHCYFGHTHLPFTDHHYEGVTFHNTGSAIRDMGFLPLNFALEA